MDSVQPRSLDSFLLCAEVTAQYLRSPTHWRSGQDRCSDVTDRAVRGTINGWSWLTGCDMTNRRRRTSGLRLRMEVRQESVRYGVPAVHLRYENKWKQWDKKNKCESYIEKGSIYKYFLFNSVKYSTVQYSTVKYSTVQYSTVQYSTVQYSTVQYSTVQYSTVPCILTCNLYTL